MSDIVGSLISGVTGIGTSQGDTHGYVEVELNNEPGTHYLIFDLASATGVVAAFMAAAAHLQQKHTPGGEIAPFPVERFSISIGSASDRSDSMVLTAETKSQLELHFLADRLALERLHSVLGQALAKTLNQPSGSPH